MSSTPTEEVVSKGDEFTRHSEVAEKIASKTVPGLRNKYFFDNMGDVGRVAEVAVGDLNNWIEIIDTRLYRGNVVGIPCRYRWTIKRWVANDMDSWLYENGWEKIAHLKADSRDHMENEMEARYYKEFDGWDVFVNIYVEFTEDVFGMLDSGDSDGAKQNDGDMDHLEAIREMKRSE